VTCGSCGAEIADKAIVCYRCGAPTTAPVAPARAGGRPAARPLGLVLLALVVAIVAGWLAWSAPAGSALRWGGGLVGLGALGAGVLVARRRG
jgi:hypothetical protein